MIKEYDCLEKLLVRYKRTAQQITEKLTTGKFS